MPANSIAIDRARCRKCSLCVLDCPRAALDSDADKVPCLSVPENCIACGHCMAICPFAAFSLNGATPDALPVPREMPRPDMLQSLLAMRRSHRRFRAENVDIAEITEMLGFVRYVPTGNNFRRLEYTLIDDKDVMEDFRRQIHEKLLKWASRATEIPLMLQATIRGIQAGKDPIFQTAPHLLVASHHQDAPTGPVDAVIALSHFELLAQSRTLGTLWLGRILTVMRHAMPELPELLQIPSEYKIGYAMLFGKTACHYPRGVDAPPALCRTLKKIEPK